MKNQSLYLLELKTPSGYIPEAVGTFRDMLQLCFGRVARFTSLSEKAKRADAAR